MGVIKGLLNLTNDYLESLEIQHPGIRSDIFTLIADGASHAMRGERVYCDLSKIEPTGKHYAHEKWAGKARTNHQELMSLILKGKSEKRHPLKVKAKKKDI